MSMWVLAVTGVLIVAAGVLLVVTSSTARGDSSIGEVRRGAFAEMLATVPAHDPALLVDLHQAIPGLPTTGEARTVIGRGSDLRPRAAGPPEWRVGDAVVPGALSGAAGLAEWAAADATVLAAMSQVSGREIGGVLDLWDAVRDGGYRLWTPGSLMKWRGHVGEHEVFEQLQSWLGDRVVLADSSTVPGFDLFINGRDYNVKVTRDYDNVAADHFVDNRDIPLIVNSDAANIPPDALHIDLSDPFDPALLEGHDVIVAEGLTLSGIERSLGDAFGPLVGGDLHFTDVTDAAGEAAIPVIGSAIRVVRSGIAEGRLLSQHGDRLRLTRNVLADVGMAGAGVATGSLMGGVIGAGLDLATLGATAGAGTFFGQALGGGIGGLLGGKASLEFKLQPLYAAQGAAAAALEDYSAAVEDVTLQIEVIWRDEIVPEARRSADQASAELEAAVARVMAAAGKDLIVAADVDAAAAAGLLADASRRVHEAVASERSLVSRRRARAWRHAARHANGTDAVMDVLLASPGGRDVVLRWITDLRNRRERIFAAAAESARIAAIAAAECRATVASYLSESKASLHRDAIEELQPFLDGISAANEQVRKELVATGVAKPGQV